MGVESKIETNKYKFESCSSTILISFFLSVVYDMAKPVTADERFALITRGLREVLGGDSIKAILDEGRNPKCYWGT